MAEPITFQNALRRFELPPRAPASARTDVAGPEGPLPELSPFDRMALAREEGRTPNLSPDELAALTAENAQSQMTPQTAGLLPSRGPVDDPLKQFQVPEGPTRDNSMDAALAELMGPQGPPAMVKPPTLHTPDELAAGMGSPQGPPTYSHPLPDRGEATTPPDTGQEPPSKMQQLAKIIGFGLDAFDKIARGAAAGEKAGSLLGVRSRGGGRSCATHATGGAPGRPEGVSGAVGAHRAGDGATSRTV